MGRRAMHADSRDVRERKYKPLWRRRRLVFALSYIAAGRLRRPIERPPNLVIFVVFVCFVVKTPCVSVPPCLRVKPRPPQSAVPSSARNPAAPVLRTGGALTWPFVSGSRSRRWH